MNPTSIFKLPNRSVAILVAVATVILAALAASSGALAATRSHRHASSRNCSTHRAHARGRRCGHTARYRAAHRRRASNPRRNLPVQAADVDHAAGTGRPDGACKPAATPN